MTLRIHEEALWYFAELAYESRIPYQTLINLYLRDCAQQRLQIDLSWYRVTAQQNGSSTPDWDIARSPPAPHQASEVK